ncbi:hypothetical protein [Cytobacillus purgationiresistens]|uniref:Uncharacterized protein n=1 Tax=Cytobacillus purgationiresistens TaxID=863449 RepID=A0ABU0AE89_9BACI|nr:hypothetical protein [Cytobacillus purgationiresistens]MDQ0268400.1 hypothetical protein [Cytobacillus purgationiresistens]
MSAIFVEGFGKHFTFFSKDSNRLKLTFSHMFNSNFFYVAIVDGEVIGMIACTDGKNPSVSIQGKEFRKHLGLVKETLAAFILKRELYLGKE